MQDYIYIGIATKESEQKFHLFKGWPWASKWLKGRRASGWDADVYGVDFARMEVIPPNWIREMGKEPHNGRTDDG